MQHIDMTQPEGLRALGKPHKDMSIQALRGIAVLLMVAGHVIGDKATRGMTVTDDSIWRYSYILLEDIRMPLFSVISGFVYAYRPIRPGAIQGFLRAKSRRLLFPLVTVGILLFGMQLVVPGINSKPAVTDAWMIVIYGHDHLWFLPSIFLIFAVVAVLDNTSVTTTRRGWLIATVVSAALFVVLRFSGTWNIFSIDGAIRLMPFFLIGYGMHRYMLFDLRGFGAAAAGAVLATLLIPRIGISVDGWDVPVGVDRLLSLAIGVVGVTLIYSARNAVRCRALAWIGGFSFGIYLLHVFGAAATRIALSKVSLDTDIAVFTIGMIAGVGLPILFQKLFGSWTPVRVGILGEKPIRGDQPADADPELCTDGSHRRHHSRVREGGTPSDSRSTGRSPESPPQSAR